MTNNIFKNEFENELYRSMEKKLANNQLEAKHGFNKLAKAVDLLNAAAEIFESAGMFSEANEVTEVLSELTDQLSKE